jgi:hypothetical protein
VRWSAGGGGSLGSWIVEAIAPAGVPASSAGPLRTPVMRESGGNPRSINLWDSNAKAGHPSMGLAQTIGPDVRALPPQVAAEPITGVGASLPGGTWVLAITRRAYTAEKRCVQVNAMVLDGSAYELEYTFGA